MRENREGLRGKGRSGSCHEQMGRDSDGMLVCGVGRKETKVDG